MPSAPDSRILFFFKRPIVLSHRKRLKAFINKIFEKNKTRLQSLNIIFCSDRQLLKINHEYLGHEYFTDIITFNYAENGGVEGEIYISVDRVRENAAQLEIKLSLELHRVIFHGVLHLCGKKDKTANEKKEIRRLEDKHLSVYFRSIG